MPRTRTRTTGCCLSRATGHEPRVAHGQTCLTAILGNDNLDCKEADSESERRFVEGAEAAEAAWRPTSRWP